jgi:hypothetical protein
VSRIHLIDDAPETWRRRTGRQGGSPGTGSLHSIHEDITMNRFAKLVAPAALALAAFGAQAEGFTPSAGGVYLGQAVQGPSLGVRKVDQSIAATPSTGGEYRGATAKASAPTNTATDAVAHRQATFLGA